MVKTDECAAGTEEAEAVLTALGCTCDRSRKKVGTLVKECVGYSYAGHAEW